MLPVYLKIKDFLSHTDSEIDFQKFNVALILGSYYGELDQSNGSGKTSLFSAIEWVLFDKSRHKKKDGVVKQDKRMCKVEYTFDVDNNTYKIIRTRDKVVGETDVMLFQLVDGNEQNISCDTNTATNNKILQIIGVDHSVFINSVYFKQNDISMFANTTSHKRKDILKSFLKMDKWAEYYKKANESARKISNAIEEKEKHALPVKEIEFELGQCNKDITDLRKEIKVGNSKLKELREQIIEGKTEYQSLYGDDVSKAELNALYSEQKKAKKQIATIDKSITKNKDLISRKDNTVADLKRQIKSLESTIKKAESIDLEKLNKNLLVGKTKQTVLESEITKLQANVNLSKNCDLCKTPLTKEQAKQIKVRINKELKDCKTKHSQISKKLKKAIRILDNKTRQVANANNAKVNKNKLDIQVLRLQNEIDRHRAENQQYTLDLKHIKQRDYQEEINIMKNKLSKQAKQDFENKIEKLEKTAQGIRREHDNLNVKYGSKTRRKKELEQSLKDQSKINNEINKLKNTFVIYNKLKTCFGKDGVQAIIIENVIEELEVYTNDILEKICNEPTSIMIKTQRQNDNGRWAETLDIIVKSGTRADEFETFSGGEQFRISLALRLALSNILSKRMGGSLKLLLLDEVSSNLDNKGLEMFMTTIKNIGKNAKILVITHNERLKEQFEDIIMVDKSSSGSRARLQ